MMTLPSSSQLISVVRAELRETLGAISSDPRVVNCLDMADSMLATVAIRCDHEIGWMISEIEAITEAAERLVANGNDDGRVRAGLDRLRDTTPVSFDMEAVRSHYQQASAVLADCAELALVAGGESQRRVDEVLATRIEHERQMRGTLGLVGRG